MEGFETGQKLTANLLNDTFNSVKERTDYLYDQLKSLISGSQLDALIINDLHIAADIEGASLDESLIPVVGDVVYYNKDLGRFEKAQYDVMYNSIGIINHADSSYAIGILIKKNETGTLGSVLVAGKLDLDTANWPIDNLLARGEIAAEGPYYLSTASPGKLTRIADNSIYMCYYGVDPKGKHFLIVNPQYQDLLLNHRHYSFNLYNKTVGVGINKYDVVAGAGEYASYEESHSRITGYPPVAIRGLAGNYNKDLAAYYGRLGPDSYTDNEPKFSISSDVLTAEGIIYNSTDLISPKGVRVVDMGTYAPEPCLVESFNGNGIQLSGDNYTDKAILSFGKNRLKIRGYWIGSYNTTYTFRLGTKNAPNIPPTNFEECYLHWETDNGKEPAGSVQIPGYNVAINIAIQSNGIATSGSNSQLTDIEATWAINSLVGYTLKNTTTQESSVIESNDNNTIVLVSELSKGINSGDEYVLSGVVDKGLEVVLENTYYSASTDYLATPAEEAGVDLNWYKWQLTFPEDIQGWGPHELYGDLNKAANKELTNNFQVYWHANATSGDLDVGPGDTGVAVSLDNNYENITIEYPRKILTVPVKDNTEVIDSQDYFEYTYDGITKKFNIVYELDEAIENTDEIPIVYSGDAYDMYKQITTHLSAIEGVIAFVDPDTVLITISSVRGIDVTYAGLVTALPTSIKNAEDPDKYILVYNHYGNPLTGESGTHKIVDGGTLVREIPLTNGIVLDFIPFIDSTTPYDPDELFAEFGTKWEFSVQDPAPGAKLKYNINTHPGLYSMYPPEPISATSLVRDGIEQYSIDTVGPESTWGVYKPALDSIYWNSDVFEYVPYSSTYIDSGIEPDYERICMLHLAKLNTGTVDVVTSLTPVEGSPIQVLKCGTKEPANTGDLDIDLDLNLTIDSDDIAGAFAVKRTEGSKLIRGPLVESLQAGPGITISSNIAKPETGEYQGKAVISLTEADAAVYKGDFAEIMLLNAKQELEANMFPYLKFISAIPNGLIAKFRVPFGYTLTNGKPHFYMTVKPSSAEIKFKATWGFISSYGGSIVGSGTATPVEWSVPELEAGSKYVLTTDSADSAVGIKQLEIPLKEGGNTPVAFYPAVTAGDILVLKLEQDIPDGDPFDIYDISWKITA